MISDEENFDSLPWKVKKTILFQTFGFPLDKTFYFSKDQLLNKPHDFIEVGNSLLQNNSTVVFRTAYIPDRYNTTWITAHSKTDITEALKQLIILADTDSQLSHILIHSDVTNKDIINHNKSFMSGRFMICPEIDLPVTEILEVLDEEYHPWELVQGKFEPFKNNYAIYRRYVGSNQWKPLFHGSSVSIKEFGRLKVVIHNLKPKAQKLLEHLASDNNKSLFVSFIAIDFVYGKYPSDIFITYDFDFGIQKYSILK